jgi:peptidoglycan/xylan/chitin deacetylase (PgdA/CDA1 family)
MMRSLLSHHEIAILFLLLDAPNQVAPGDPDAIALQEARLVEIVSTTFDDERLRLTPAGAELLRRLGMTAS